MKKKSQDVVHSGMVSNFKSPAMKGNWGIRHVHGFEKAQLSGADRETLLDDLVRITGPR